MPRNHGPNIICLVALGPTGMHAPCVFEGAVTSEFFLKWLQEWLLPTLVPGTTVVLDNLAVHRNADVRPTIEGACCQVRDGSLRLVIGTDAASEGLNLQRLGTLINLDLPWNPTRLEQRKGRIQRIGQSRDTVYVYNMRYRGSVEDRVHQLLSLRLAAISGMFGQLPDTLEDVWVTMAQKGTKEALQKIDEVPTVHPFQLRYDRISNVDWESCSEVLDSAVQLQMLAGGW